MVDVDGFGNLRLRCMYREDDDCARPAVGCCPMHGPRSVDVRCAYDCCPVLKPIARSYGNGTWAITMLEETGISNWVAGPFATKAAAEAALADYPTRDSGIAAIAARRS